MKFAPFSFSIVGILLGYHPLALSQDEGTFELGEMVVTATRTSNNLDDVPATMQVFNSTDIKEMGATTVKDVLTKAANIQLNAQRGGINMRGMGFDYTVVLVNGRKPGGLENIKDFQNLLTNTLNVNTIERIEIVRGQSGSMYGSNAIGGVINIITKDSLKEQTSVSVSHGNLDSILSLSHDFGSVDNWNAIVNLNYNKYNPERTENTGTDNSWSTTKNGYLASANMNIGYHFGNQQKINLEAGLIKDDYKIETYSASQDTLTIRNTSRELRNLNLIYNGATGMHDYSAAVSFNETYNHLFTTNTNNIYYTDKFRNTIFDGQNAWQLNENNTLLFGGEYVYEYTNQQNTKDNNTLNRIGFYAQTENSLADGNILLIPSMRYDNYSSFGGELTYKLAGTWQFIENHRLKTSFGTGYKAPTLIQLYGTESTSNGTVYGNANLKPEYSDTWEIRYETNQDRYQFALGYYQNDLTNYMTSILTRPDPSGGRDADYLRVNIGRVKLKGIEAELRADLTESIYVRTTYNYIDAINQETGARVGYNAEHIYGLDLGYYNSHHELGMNLWGNWNDNYLYGSDVFDFYNFNFAINKVLNDTYSMNFGLYNFIQSERDAINSPALDPMEWRVTLQMNF